MVLRRGWFFRSFYASLRSANLERTEDRTISAKPIFTVRPARRLSTLLLERCRQHCSKFADTCTLSLCRARQVKSDFSYIFQKPCSPRILRPYHNLHFAFGDVFGDAGDNLCGLVDGEAVIVLFWNEMFCARSAPNAGRWSLVAGRWSLVAGRWSLVAGRERLWARGRECQAVVRVFYRFGIASAITIAVFHDRTITYRKRRGQ